MNTWRPLKNFPQKADLIITRNWVRAAGLPEGADESDGDIQGALAVKETLLKSCQIEANCSRKQCKRLMYISERTEDTKSFLPASLVAFVCCLILVSTVFAQSGSVYVDPQQHFTIQVPMGWVAKPYHAGGASGVTIVHGGDAYVQVFLQKGIDSATFLKTLKNGIQMSHPDYHVSYQGLRTVAGEPRTFIVGETLETPGASRTRVYLETFAANGFAYAIIACSAGKNTPGKDLMADYKVSQEMIQSLNLKTASTQTSLAAAAIPSMSSPPAASEVGSTDNASAVLSPRDQKKLAALDAALQGGALSEEEYQVKKIALYSSALQRRNNSSVLKALNQAYEDGVLTLDEYHRKKEALGAGDAPATALAEPNPDSEEPALEPMAASTAESDPQTEPLPKSWITHNDPAGFVVNLPANWTIGKAPSTGQLVLRGTRGEEIVIWPLHLQQPKLEAQGAAILLQEFARKFDVLMPWGEVQTTQNLTRVLGQGDERSGAAILSWANSPSGASVYFYGMEAPGNIYESSTESFVAILKSFHVVQNPSPKDVPGAATDSKAGEMGFVNWNDPHEGAFHVSVPQGWQVIGGAYRLSAVDVRYAVVASSADGQIRASIGDSMVGAFTQPTPMLSMAGLREGGYQLLGDGTKVEILRYNSGQQFARSYVQTLVSRQCSNIQIDSNNPREDLASTFRQSAANEGFGNVFLSAGDISFTCNLDGRPVKGKYVAATVRFSPNVSPMWFVYRLYGYIASAEREQDGEKVLGQMIQSWKFDPAWEAQQKNTANAALQQDNARSQEIRERAQQAIAEDQRQTSEMINKGYEQRQKVYDEIDRKRENSILGTLDVVDPETGRRYKVSNYGDYHYLSNDGYIFSTNSPGAPGSNLREMIALP